MYNFREDYETIRKSKAVTIKCWRNNLLSFENKTKKKKQ